MLNWIIGRIKCFGGTHERSIRHAVKAPGADRYTSICTHCGMPMERIEKRNWVVLKRR